MGRIIIGILLVWLWPWQQVPVKVIDASSQTVIPGRKESRVSVQYEVMVRAGKNSNKLIINRMWVKGHGVPVKVFSWPEKKSAEKFSKGDTLILHTIIFETGSEKEATGDSLLPEKYRDRELVIGCRIRRKQTFVPVTTIKRLPDDIKL